MLQKDLREFVGLLNSHEVDYVIVGGHAVVSFEDAWAGRVADDFDGLPVNFLGRQELLRNKQATGRTKDQDDLEKLGP